MCGRDHPNRCREKEGRKTNEFLVEGIDVDTAFLKMLVI